MHNLCKFDEKLTSYFCYFVLLYSVLPMIVKLLYKEEE